MSKPPSHVSPARQAEMMSRVIISPGLWYIRMYSEAFEYAESNVRNTFKYLYGRGFVDHEEEVRDHVAVEAIYPTPHFWEVAADLASVSLEPHLQVTFGEAVQSRRKMRNLEVGEEVDIAAMTHEAVIYEGGAVELGKAVDLSDTTPWFQGRYGWLVLIDAEVFWPTN